MQLKYPSRLVNNIVGATKICWERVAITDEIKSLLIGEARAVVKVNAYDPTTGVASVTVEKLSLL